MILTLTYDSVLSRVRLSATSLNALTSYVTVDRSTDQVVWATVRGGTALTPSASAVSLDDYEFAADVENFYRITEYDSGDSVLATETNSITPTLDGVWLKSVSRPFLNRKIRIRRFSDVQRPSRAGVFDIVGRSFPIAVTDVRSSRRWTLEVYADDAQDARDLDLILASGDVLFIHAPASGRLSVVPSGYVSVGESSETLLPTHDLSLRVFSLPCAEVAAPGADVVGVTSTWQTVLNTYAAWADMLSAHATWADVLELIGSPSDVIVP